MVKNLPANAGDSGDMGLILGLGRSPGVRKWQPTPIFLPGEIPWTEEPGRLQSMESQKVRHNLVTKHQKQERFEWIVHQRYAWKISEK